MAPRHGVGPGSIPGLRTLFLRLEKAKQYGFGQFQVGHKLVQNEKVEMICTLSCVRILSGERIFLSDAGFCST